jgi:hypothetical protein
MGAIPIAHPGRMQAGAAGRVGQGAMHARGVQPGGRGAGPVAAGGFRQAAPAARGGQGAWRGNAGVGRVAANNGLRQAGGMRMAPAGFPVRMAGQQAGFQGRFRPAGGAQLPAARPANPVRSQGAGRPGGRR